MKKTLSLIVMILSLSCTSYRSIRDNVETNNIELTWSRAHGYAAQYQHYPLFHSNYVLDSFTDEYRIRYIKEMNRVIIDLLYPEPDIEYTRNARYERMVGEVNMIKRYLKSGSKD